MDKCMSAGKEERINQSNLRATLAWPGPRKEGLGTEAGYGFTGLLKKAQGKAEVREKAIKGEPR